MCPEIELPRPYLRFSPFLAAVVVSLVVHAGCVYWWLHRPVSAPSVLAMQTVTVDLLALDPPSGLIQQSAPETPQPENTPVPEKTPVTEASPLPVEAPAAAKQPVPARPVAPRPVKTTADTASRPAAVPAPASAAVPTATPPAPVPISAARYDADYLNNPPPVYPPLARRLGEEGKVLLRVQVSPEGLPLAVEIHQSSGHPRLDEAARKAAGRWRFVPARQGNNAITSWVEIPVQFSLRQ